MPRSIKDVLDQCDDYLNGDETDIEEKQNDDVPEHVARLREQVELYEDVLVDITGLHRVDVIAALEHPDPVYKLSKLLGLDRFGKGHDIDMMIPDNVVPIKD